MTNNVSRRTISLAKFNIADAKARFSELVQKAMVGDEVIIARDNKPVVKLVPLVTSGKARKPGSAKGQIWMAPDFDAIPADFEDYT
jgi:prevent-host-death family protein